MAVSADRRKAEFNGGPASDSEMAINCLRALLSIIPHIV